jgi:hypothetical protein
MGDVNNGTDPVGLGVSAVIPNDATPVVLAYTIINNGHTDQSTFEKAINSVLSALGSAGAKEGGAGLGALLGFSAGSAVLPVIGSALGLLAGWLVSKLVPIIFADCDGPVAAGLYTYTGQQVIESLSNGNKISKTDVVHNGQDSPVGCGANSLYYTTDTITETIRFSST